MSGAQSFHATAQAVLRVWDALLEVVQQMGPAAAAQIDSSLPELAAAAGVPLSAREAAAIYASRHSPLRQELRERIAERRRLLVQVNNQREVKQTTARHVLSQYRINWTGGVRTIVEAHFQQRLTNPATPVTGPKRGAQVENVLTALQIGSLWNKLDEYITDRLADFVVGLAGLATKLDFPRISLGDVDARWNVRALTKPLESRLAEQGLATVAGTTKKGGLWGGLTARRSDAGAERRAVLSRAARLIASFIESELFRWSTALMARVEAGILRQIDAALAAHGFPGPHELATALAALDRLEAALASAGTRETALASAETAAATCLAQLAVRVRFADA